EAARGAGGGADEEAFPILLDQGLGERVEIGEDLGPGAATRALHGGLGAVDALLELGLEDEGEEGARDVAADGLVELVEDRPGGEEVLLGSEGLLDARKLLVAKHCLERVEIGVGAQHEDAVEPGVLLGLGAVDGEVAGAFGHEKAAVVRQELTMRAGVADERLVALLEL